MISPQNKWRPYVTYLDCLCSKLLYFLLLLFSASSLNVITVFMVRVLTKLRATPQDQWSVLPNL